MKDAGLANVDHAIAEYMAGLLDESGLAEAAEAAPLVTEVDGMAVPLWAQRPFAARAAMLSGLALALPTGLFRPLEGPIKPARRDDPACVIGVVMEQGQRWCCIDPRVFMLKGQSLPERSPGGVFLAVEGSTFALHVDSLDAEISIRPEQVLWRGEGGQRPWLAGVTRDPQRALLDASGVIEAIDQHIRQR